MSRFRDFKTHWLLKSLDLLLGFVHVVGIDLHQKLVFTKASNLNFNFERENTQLSAFAPTQEVWVIDDDDEETISQAPTEKPRSFTESDDVDDSM